MGLMGFNFAASGYHCLFYLMHKLRMNCIYPTNKNCCVVILKLVAILTITAKHNDGIKFFLIRMRRLKYQIDFVDLVKYSGNR